MKIISRNILSLYHYVNLDRRAAGQAHPPRSHHRDERRQLPPQTEQQDCRHIVLKANNDLMPPPTEEDIFPEQLAVTFMLNNDILAAGKPKKVALTACMRKLLVILNSMLKRRSPWCAERAGTLELVGQHS